jgi:hypothetical protein
VLIVQKRKQASTSIASNKIKRSSLFRLQKRRSKIQDTQYTTTTTATNTKTKTQLKQTQNHSNKQPQQPQHKAQTLTYNRVITCRQLFSRPGKNRVAAAPAKNSAD